MPPRQTFFTDERVAHDEMIAILERLPQGSGVVFRHDGLPGLNRIRLGQKVAEICHSRGLVLSVAGEVSLAHLLNAKMVHRPAQDPEGLPFSLPVHDEAEARDARERGADLIYVSPVFATQSHPGAPHLGLERAKQLAEMAGCPAIALGGMDETRFAELSGFAGWAGIGAFAA
ncbi:thiamine phosphate synthase [Sphingomicrobium sediminis]|uniref:Thiamine phosphate synthase n=1 Tax=Sphingomicrobium sediminis TaxID=2950949 RepID=A0A9X2J2S4_9SPHN|nr:thiamine phosphate synthase [Sphingomicrobium sediminis]MCM8558069.1 thiamine phosphate synthase [Sphingomicrobium sediminis]